MRTIEELEHLLIIDRNRLDDELVQQPQLYWESSEGYALAAANRDTAKFSLERCEADCAIQIRSEQLEKLSDKKIADMVSAHPTYIGYYESYLNYKFVAEKWDALTDSFRQRSTAIRDLVQLHTTGYWGSGLTNSLPQTYAEKYRQKHEATKSEE